MKKIGTVIFLVMGITITASAQMRQQHNSLGKHPSTHHVKSGASVVQKKSTQPADSINPRRIYPSSKTKQKATPTGQQATGTNGAHANTPKNSSTGK